MPGVALGMRAAVLIGTDAGQVDAVAAAVTKLSGVKRTLAVTGRADVVAFIDAATFDEVQKVAAAVRDVRGVATTETLLEVR